MNLEACQVSNYGKYKFLGYGQQRFKRCILHVSNTIRITFDSIT